MGALLKLRTVRHNRTPDGGDREGTDGTAARMVVSDDGGRGRFSDSVWMRRRRGDHGLYTTNEDRP